MFTNWNLLNINLKRFCKLLTIYENKVFALMNEENN